MQDSHKERYNVYYATKCWKSISHNRVLKFNGIEDLQCSIYEISEVQSYGLPQNPLDDGSFVADTIYRTTKKR